MTTSIHDSLDARAQAGLPEMRGTREGQKVPVTWENERDGLAGSCYYARP